MHTLSRARQHSVSSRRGKRYGPTDIVCLIKNDYALLAHLRRDLFCNLWIEEVVEGVDDDIEIWQLWKT